MCSANFLCSLTFTRLSVRIIVEGKGPFCSVTLLTGNQSSFSLYLSTACKTSCMKTHCHSYMNNRTNPDTVIKRKKTSYFKKINSMLYFFSIAIFPRSCSVDKCTFLDSTLYVYHNSCSAAHRLHKYKAASCLYLLYFDCYMSLICCLGNVYLIPLWGKLFLCYHVKRQK